MALKDTWVDKTNGVDEANAEDINMIAHSIIELEENGGSGGSITIDDVMSDTSENAVQNKIIKAYVDGQIIGEVIPAIEEKADTTYVDESIQSAILDSWEVAV